MSREFFCQKFRLKVWSLFLVVVMLGLALGFTFRPVRAAGLELSTPYPGITVVPGEKVSFPLEIRYNGSGRKVGVAVIEKPEGWETSLEGRGKAVHQVFVGSDHNPGLDLKVQVPAEAEEGNYQVKVRAEGGGLASVLTLDLLVSREGTGGGEMIAQYPQLQGPSGATFQFRVDLTNNTPREQSYSLGAQVPAGWQVSFSPAYDSKQIASLSLEAGKSQGLDVKITPPEHVAAGTYTIPVTAVSADSRVQTELQVIITGTYDLVLTTPSGRLNAQTVAGRETALTLEVQNHGSADLENISFSSREPSGWSVTFSPEEIDLLAPGEARQVTAYIKPAAKAIAGDYLVNLTASTRETSGTAQIRVLVKTSTLWGLVGIVIILAVIAGVGAAFRQYGRR